MKNRLSESYMQTGTLKLILCGYLMLCCGFTLWAQVTNEVDVFIRPDTEVHIFENVTNTGTGTMTVGSGGLLYVDGTLVNNGSMTFENSASLLRGSTGSDGTGSGTYFVKRQGSSSSTVYNYWSSPMTSYSTVPGISAYSYDPNLSTQDFGDDQPADPGWVGFGGNMTPGTSHIGRGAGLYTFSGDVNNGNVNASMVFYPYAPGNTDPGTPFNLLGNPYPSAISCAGLVAANADVNGSIYFWDDDLSGGSGYTSSDYAVWNGTGSLGTGAGTVGAPNGFISTGQGFMIRGLSGSAVLNFTNAMRVAGNNAQFFRPAGQDSRLWFSIEGDELFNQILIGVLQDATDNEDRLYDAVKLRGNSSVSLAAMDNGREYAILAFPPPSFDKTIPLSVHVGETGSYIFHANTMEGFGDLNVYFSDIQGQQNILLEEGTQIQVPLTEGQYDGRFFLNFSSNLITGIDEPIVPGLSAYTFADELHLQLNNSNAENAALQLFDTQGRSVMYLPNLRFNDNRAVVSVSGISTGVYVVRVLSRDHYLSQKILKR